MGEEKTKNISTLGKRHNLRLEVKTGKNLSGSETANYLDKYAEIGFQYVLKVTSVIKSNKFDKFDNIRLETNYN